MQVSRRLWGILANRSFERIFSSRTSRIDLFEAMNVGKIVWFEAMDYCRYSGGRLPTFVEWRKAAYTEWRTRPVDGFIAGRTYRYPVGDKPVGMNISQKKHVDVGTTKRGVNGLYDMGANVWEWTADRRGDDALTAGGSWWYGHGKTQASGAHWKPAAFYAVYVGFRCVYDGTASNRKTTESAR